MLITLHELVVILCHHPNINPPSATIQRISLKLIIIPNSLNASSLINKLRLIQQMLPFFSLASLRLVIILLVHPKQQPRVKAYQQSLRWPSSKMITPFQSNLKNKITLSLTLYFCYCTHILCLILTENNWVVFNDW